MVKAIGLAQPSAPAPRAPKGTGFTLLETVVTMAVTSVLPLTTGSAMLMVGRVLPDARSPTAASVDGATAVEQIATDQQATVQTRVRILNRPEVRQ